jgi:hypothetical protein
LLKFHAYELVAGAATVTQYCVPAVRSGVKSDVRVKTGLFAPSGLAVPPGIVKLSRTAPGASLTLVLSATVIGSRDVSASLRARVSVLRVAVREGVKVSPTQARPPKPSPPTGLPDDVS